MNTVALILALAILAGLTAMQVALIAGAPIGHFAWGGKNRVLPRQRRWGAVVAIILYIIFAVVLVMRSGTMDDAVSPFIYVAAWVIFGYTALSVLPNLASKSRQERAVQVPVSILLAIAFGIVAGS